MLMGKIKRSNLQTSQLGYSQDADSGDRGGLGEKTQRGITVRLRSLGIEGRAELCVIITKKEHKLAT